MRLPTAMIVGMTMMGAGLVPAQVAAQPKVYAYESHANYCPAGLQPITIAGVICCGTPNQHMSYQQVMAHPAPKKHKVRHYKPKRASYDCHIGEKGCR